MTGRVMISGAMITNSKPHSFYIFGLIALLMSSLVLFACGKKAPPVPPKQLPIYAPIALKGTVQGDTVILNWRASGSQRPVKYEVFRAAADAAKPACPGCPLIFQAVGSLNVDPATETVEFKDQVIAGFIYTYKVLPVGSSGDKGPASNLLVIDRSSR